MKTYIEERAVEVAKFMIHTNATVRETAKKFGISKSTALKSSRPLTLRRTTATIMTIPRLGRTRTKRKARERNEIYQQPL